MNDIHLWGVRQNNLKNIDIKIPLGSFTVICGPSGSGKSSLAFETLFAEGQRRYIESLSNYARQFLGKAPKPDIDGIENIPPAISIEQKNSVKTSRSTVGTSTEVIDYLRLLYEKIGVVRCPTYEFELKGETPAEAAKRALKEHEDKRAYLLAPVYYDKKILSGKKLLHYLLKEGYIRIYVPPKKTKAETELLDEYLIAPCLKEPKSGQLGEIIELSPTTKLSQIPKRDFYVIVDRIVLKQDDRARLIDSFQQAYEASLKFNTGIPGGRARVVTTEGDESAFSEDNACSICGFSFPDLSSRLFSFNNPLGACETCNGFGNILDLDPDKIIPNHNLSLAEGAIQPFAMPSAANDRRKLLSYCRKKRISIEKPYKELKEKQKELLWEGDDEFFGVRGLFDYLETKKYKMHVRVFLSRFKSPFGCPDCEGTRLKPEVELVDIAGYTINMLSEMTISELYEAMVDIELNEFEEEVAGEILSQINARLKFLVDVGVGYLTLNRPTKTLSGGEFQRLTLAKQLGMGLSQALYVLDEPTIGLHPRDNERLINILKDLRALGNTLVVVEHDRDVIENSTHIIEMGPGSGMLGGKVVYAGKTEDFYNFPDSPTVPYLSLTKKWIPQLTPRPVDKETYKYKIQLEGCKGNNLKNVNLELPLNRLVTVTGVSGSGKSTLITQTLYPAVARALGIDFLPTKEFKSIAGYEFIKNVLLIDQKAIGKSARSSPVTYLKVFDAIRNVFAGTKESKDRGYTPGTFSLNVEGGRCPVCKGLGSETIDMLFMDDVSIPCESCNGKRYRDEILEIKFNKRNIFDVLNLTVQEAMDFFVSYPNIRKPLSFLKEVGLEYLQLGQAASTLSGGESQRLKIAKELLQTNQKATLYILDEPTTGLHFREIDLLMKVLNQLVENGGSVLLIEHNLEVISRSDYIIDIGPEAGDKGGKIVAHGTPDELMNQKKSHTARFLKEYLLPENLKSKKGSSKEKANVQKPHEIVARNKTT